MLPGHVEPPKLERRDVARRRVLLVDPEQKHRSTLLKVLRCIAGEVECCSSLAQVPPGVGVDLVICDYDALSEAERGGMHCGLPDALSTTQLLLLSSGQVRHDFVKLFGGRVLTNLVARNAEADLRDFIVTVQKLLCREVFGIEKYFCWGVEPLEFSVRRSSEKGQLLAEAERFAERLGIQPRMANLFCSVADELLTNAVYNAPLDAAGSARHAHVSRAEEVALEPGEEVSIRFCCDGLRLGISATDPFGSLTPELVQSYLAKCFRKDGEQVDRKAGGAGLGLYYVFESISHFVVNLCPGKRTEIIGLFDIRGSFRDFASAGKSFNIFLGEVPA